MLWHFSKHFLEGWKSGKLKTIIKATEWEDAEPIDHNTVFFLGFWEHYFLAFWLV